MPRLRRYVCTFCLTETDRKDLLVKKVLFTEMGAGGKLVRSRVVNWLCPNCTVKDPDWTQASNQGSARSRRISG